MTTFEKGRVERAIRYLRTSFFPARRWTDLADLNQQALTFCETEAAQHRCPDDKTLTVRAAWELERPRLTPLPQVTSSTSAWIIWGTVWKRRLAKLPMS